MKCNYLATVLLVLVAAILTIGVILPSRTKQCDNLPAVVDEPPTIGMNETRFPETLVMKHARLSPMNRMLSVPRMNLNNSCIAVFGDSIAMAYDIKDRKKKSYSEKLRIKLNSIGVMTEIIRHARPGYALQDWLLHDMLDVLARTACKSYSAVSTIVVQMGVNDALRLSSVSHFTSWYSLLASRIKFLQPNATVILCGLSLINHETVADGWVAEANVAISEIASAHDFLFVDLFVHQAAALKKGRVLDDEVHPSPLGIDVITDSLFQAMTEPSSVHKQVFLMCGKLFFWSGYTFSPTWPSSDNCRGNQPVSVKAGNGSELHLSGVEQTLFISPPWQNSFSRMPKLGVYSLVINGRAESTFEVTPHTKNIVWKIAAGTTSVSFSLVKEKKY
eukprot:TRINITY_DN30464_c0_g1_i1.p1 TRINITY_DN30464_c0_g1~~TRINITY_DN30464_c0_g1_i1.p1  ORF type:complete len:390 (+),score=44.99 TRINITY_DN30464_c0_g1_i1:21-1190(+)